LDLVTESAPVIFQIQNIIESVKKIGKDGGNKGEHGDKMDVESNEGGGGGDNMGHKKDEIKRAITVKDLSNLTNSVTLLYSKNTDFDLFRDILNSLIQYQMAVMTWSEKAQSLLPVQSTRSKMGKDMKSTKISDLETVNEYTEIHLLSYTILFILFCDTCTCSSHVGEFPYPLSPYQCDLTTQFLFISILHFILTVCHSFPQHLLSFPLLFSLSSSFLLFSFSSSFLCFFSFLALFSLFPFFVLTTCPPIYSYLSGSFPTYR
jgi:hypothetical protein